MTYTVQNVVDLARTQMNDDAKIRATDLKGEYWANACLNAMGLLRPDLFTVFGAITPVVDQAWQDLITANAEVLALYNILGVVNGNAILQCELRPLLAAVPGALYEASGTPVNWARDPADENATSGTRYFLYPRPITGTQILVQYSQSAAYKVLADLVPLPAAYRPVLAHYIKFCFESVDDDYVIAQRAALELASFMALIGAGAKTKIVEPNT